MLYPQQNRCRTVMDLSGFWEIKIDREQIGESQNWSNGFDADTRIGVPGSWNEQLAESGLMNYIGQVWYQKSFYWHRKHAEEKCFIRFGAVDYHAKIWINGDYVGDHSGGFLPFIFDITSHLDFNDKNKIVVRVDNTLSHDTIPQGITCDNYSEFNKQRDQTFPPAAFDFFTYGGLQRPVRIYTAHELHLTDTKIITHINKDKGIINYQAEFSYEDTAAQVIVTIYDGDTVLDTHVQKPSESSISGEFTISLCRFWCPGDPHLYQIHFEITSNKKLIDEYYLDIGVREIKVKNDKLLLNGEPIFLKGFGKHEDFAVLGKGLSYPLIIKDFQLLKWVGANSFRTAHYPYAEEIIQMADKEGILVIGEVPAVSLNFKYVSDKTFENHKRTIAELIARDKNHPSVISWCVANEPGIWGEQESISNDAEQYWEHIFNYTRTLDLTRPLTAPTFPRWQEKDLVYKFCDYISLNRYHGWYEMPGDLEKAGERLREELIKIHEIYHKPILLSEFGADTIEGLHATYPQMFTEEYQSALIEKYFEIIESFDFTIGEHIWNFADFRTPQHFRRVVLNKKGVFTRQREPKSAAFVVRKHWTKNKI